METSSSLSIESFSYSWLVNLKPSLDSQENSLRTSLDASADEAYSYIEMDPKMPPSKRFFVRRSSQDLKFDFPTSPSPLGLVHADELMSNGYLMPLFMDPLLASNDHYSPPGSPHSRNSPPVTDVVDPDCSSLRRSCRRVSKRILQKYLNFLRPLYRRIRGNTHNNKSKIIGSKSSEHVVEKRVQVGKSRVFTSETTSPRISVAYSAPDAYCWRNSCDSDSSIYEAVLHCKRSIGN